MEKILHWGISLLTLILVIYLIVAGTVDSNLSTLGSANISTYGRTVPSSGGAWSAIDNLVSSELWGTGSSTLESSLYLGGAGTFNSTLTILSTTTITNPALAIGTSTPASNAHVSISVPSGNAATTTLYLSSPFGTKGGCIQMENTASTTVRLYATSTGIPAVWESGACQ